MRNHLQQRDEYTCSTSNQSWTATRDEKQGPASFPATEGSYTGTNPQGIGGGDVDFNVSPSGNLQDVVVETTKLGCAPSREFYNHFEMAEVTVAADGAFPQELKQTSVIETAYKEFNEAHITYTFSGHVHGAGVSGEQRIAGVYREDITYNNGRNTRARPATSPGRRATLRIGCHPAAAVDRAPRRQGAVIAVIE